MCGCLKVSVNAYYAWGSRKGRRSEREAAIRAAVKEVFYFHRRAYGSKRLSDELKSGGRSIGRFLTRRVMNEEGLVAKGPKQFKPRTTDSRGTMASPNLLKDVDNKALGAGDAMVGDITYMPMTNSRFCYLAMFQDKRTKRIVGCAVSSRMTAELVTDALKMALRRGFVKRNAVVHTDRGSQYASNLFRQMLERCKLRQSMSAQGNCYDNAQAESFFSRFKTEADMRVFGSVEEARSEAFDYIECFYNRIRRHSALGTSIPIFEQHLTHQTKAVEIWKSPKPLSHIPTAPTTRQISKEKRETFLSAKT